MTGLIVWVALAASAVVICVAVICAVRSPMRKLLEVNSYISPAKEFYLRAFSVLVFLAALAVVSKTDTPESGKAFMEYVWWVVKATQPIFSAFSFGLIVYAALLTILFAVLGRYRD
jgi:predicted cation transporter